MTSRWRLALIALAMAVGSGTVQAQPSRTVPAGTRLIVRTTHPILADRSFVGMKVPAVLDSPLFDTSGRRVARRGSPATLEVVGVRTRGRDRVTLAVDAVHVGRRTFPVATNHITMTGPREGSRTAATGGTAGAITSGSSRRNVTVPVDTRLQFRTFAPVRMRR